MGDDTWDLKKMQVNYGGGNLCGESVPGITKIKYKEFVNEIKEVAITSQLTTHAVLGVVTTKRIATLRVTRAYRTVSAEAALFLAGTPQGDLLALERKRVKSKLDDPDRAYSKDEIRGAERDILLAARSNRWSRGVRGAWTRTILPDLIRWTKRCPKDLTFHVTQALTGHGCFRYYLHRMKRAPDAACLYCQHPEDTAEHTIFDCVHWDPLRLPVKMFVGNRNITPGDVQDLLCGPSDVPSSENDRL
ncbi:hypothetical protein QTP88_011122 [Uroleucon formosanum]